MGWTARDLRRASLWEFGQAYTGWRRFHAAPVDDTAQGGAKPPPPSAEAHRAAMAKAWAICNPGQIPPHGERRSPL